MCTVMYAGQGRQLGELKNSDRVRGESGSRLIPENSVK